MGYYTAWDKEPPTAETPKLQKRSSKITKNYVLSFDTKTKENVRVVSWDNDDVLHFTNMEEAERFLMLMGEN